MTALPASRIPRPGGRGKRRLRECTVAACRRGFYGVEGPCPDCRAGVRLSQLQYRFEIQQAGKSGTRRRLRQVLEAMLGPA